MIPNFPSFNFFPNLAHPFMRLLIWFDSRLSDTCPTCVSHVFVPLLLISKLNK